MNLNSRDEDFSAFINKYNEKIKIMDKNFSDFLEQTHQVHSEIKCDIQIMSRGLMYHMNHPELYDLLPDLSSIEDWLFMRDPDGDTDVSRVHFMLLREPAGAQTKLWKRMTKMTI